MRTIDINSDLGEGAGHDPEIMRFVSSANIACGAHAGDEETMRKTVALAKKNGVSIGAHPGYPDKANFGRDPMNMEPLALVEEIAAQIRALVDVANAASTRVRHVKAHGALYNQAWNDTTIAKAIVAGVTQVFPPPTDIAVFAAPRSALADVAAAAGLRVVREGFVDRAYQSDGTLRSRKLPGALHTDPAVAVAQALSFVREGGVRAQDGPFLELVVETLCLHGDTPGAVAIAAAVREALTAAGITVRPAVIWT